MAETDPSGEIASNRWRCFELDKLVTDEVFNSMLELGQIVQVQVLVDDKAFMSALVRKFQEECLELCKEVDSQGSEEADVTERYSKASQELNGILKVLDQILVVRGVGGIDNDPAVLESGGAFSRRFFVERLFVRNSDPWAKYYAAEPERFPEI